MPFTQVSDAIASIRRCYQAFAAELESVPRTDPEVREFVDKLAAAQRRMDEAVRELIELADEKTLNAWLQFFPDQELSALAARHEELSSVDDLIDYYSAFNKRLVDAFELIGRSTECEEVRDLFQQLATVEGQNARDRVWAGRRLA